MKMGFGQAISACFSKYATFQGRAHRPEYWWWMLFLVLYYIAIWIIGAVLALILGTVIAVIVGALLFLAIILPTISVAVRRLHDTDRAGGWWWIQCIPLIGVYWFLYIVVQPGTMKDPSPAPNRFGDGLS